MTLKETLISKCYEFASERKSHIDFQMKEIKEALFEEIKSSVGDKHETGRAMIQLEMEKAGQQLSEVTIMQEVLNKIAIEKSKYASEYHSLEKQLAQLSEEKKEFNLLYIDHLNQNYDNPILRKKLIKRLKPQYLGEIFVLMELSLGKNVNGLVK